MNLANVQLAISSDLRMSLSHFSGILFRNIVVRCNSDRKWGTPGRGCVFNDLFSPLLSLSYRILFLPLVSWISHNISCLWYSCSDVSSIWNSLSYAYCCISKSSKMWGNHQCLFVSFPKCSTWTRISIFVIPVYTLKVAVKVPPLIYCLLLHSTLLNFSICRSFSSNPS